MLKFMTSYVAPAKRYYDLSQRSLPMHFDADDLCGSLIARVTRGEETRYTLQGAAQCLQHCVETLRGAPPQTSLRELTSLLGPVYQEHTGLKLGMALSRSGTPRLAVPESDLLAHLILQTLSQGEGQQRLHLEANVLSAMAQA